jgi:hypothetical protein
VIIRSSPLTFVLGVTREPPVFLAAPWSILVRTDLGLVLLVFAIHSRLRAPLLSRSVVSKPYCDHSWRSS